MKKNLQDVTDLKVMNIKECLDSLGWDYTQSGESNYNNISCPCGGELEFRGFIGTEVIECLKCGKHMVDLFSPIQVTSGSCSVLNISDYEIIDNKHWVVINNSNKQ